MHPYSPEPLTTPPPEAEKLLRAPGSRRIFHALCIQCDAQHNLHIDLGALRGIIPRSEAALENSHESAVLSRVGKPVCFQVLGLCANGTLLLSRRAAQQEARNYFFQSLRPGDILPARVQCIAPFGVFCDIGCGFSALMRLNRCCISRLPAPGSLFCTGQEIRAAVLGIDNRQGIIHLTGRELLGTWEENTRQYLQGQIVPGIARSILPYGIFVELQPNLSGLAEPTAGIAPGDPVCVNIRAILPEKHKVKLTILEKLPALLPRKYPEYYITSGHIGKWEYFPGSRAVTYF